MGEMTRLDFPVGDEPGMYEIVIRKINAGSPETMFEAAFKVE